MASYDVKAILGEKLKRLTDKTLKAIVDCMCTLATSLCSLEKRISALESVEIPEGGYKPMQEPLASPTASGTDIQFIESVSQDATGRMTATKKTVRSASTSQTGVVQLTDSHSSTSTSTAATPKNVKEAYDLASGKADPASVVDSASYDSSSHTIVFKHGSAQLFTLDAAAFVKDGMVDSVAISNGNLVITFNTDAGKQPISIPLTDIFNPNNYYTKTETNTLLGSKVDTTDSRLLPDADVALILYGDSTYTNVKALYNAGKKLYLVTDGSIQPSGRFEYRIPLTLITYDANQEVNAFYFEQSQDDRAGASEVGSIAVYRLDSTGWTTTPKQVGYATNAGHAANADSSGTASVADSVSTAIGSGEIMLLGVANNVAGNYQPKMHVNIRAYYQNGNMGHLLIIGPERGARGAADKGGVRLSGGTGYYTQLQTADFTADRWHKLPDESGNLAVTSGNYPNMTVGSATNATNHINNGNVHVTPADKAKWNKAAQRTIGDTKSIIGSISLGIPVEFGVEGDNPSVKFGIGTNIDRDDIHLSLTLTNGANNWMANGQYEVIATTSSVVQDSTTNYARGASNVFGEAASYRIASCPIPVSSTLTSKGIYKAKIAFYDATGTSRINILDIEICFTRTPNRFVCYGTASVINALDN